MASKPKSPSIDYKMARAYGHPIRARALVMLAQRMASPKEIAEHLDESIGKVSYHVRELRDDGLIELVETDGSRGGVQHFYKATLLPYLDVAGMEAQTEAERMSSAQAVLGMMVGDIATAIGEGSMNERPERILSRFPARVDEQGWQELFELYDKAIFQSIEIHNKAVARLKESGEEGFSAVILSLVFELPRPEESQLEQR